MVSREVSPKYLRRKKKRKLTPAGVVLVVLIALIFGYGIFKVSGPTVEAIFKKQLPMLEYALADKTIEESKEIFAHPVLENGEYEIKDYVLYGEVLTLYSEKYDLGIKDEMRGKSVLCRNLSSGSEYVYYMGNDLDSGIPIYELPVGVYSVYVSSLLSNERIYMDVKANDVFYAVTRDGITRKFTFIADTNYFYPHDESVATSKNYVYIMVEDSKLPEENYDVVIDPGHLAYDCYSDACWGYIDNGSISNDGKYVEAEMNYELAVVVKEKLEAAGLKVKMTRDDETPVDMYGEGSRVEQTINSQAKYYISIHENAIDDTSVHGSEVWYSSYSSSTFAESILNRLVSDTILVASGNIGSGNSIPSILTSNVSASTYGKAYDGYMMIREPGGYGTQAGQISEAAREYNGPLLEGKHYGAQAVIVESMYLTNKKDCANWDDNYVSYGEAIANGILDYLNMDSYKDYLN